jgi:Cys-tRNA(Pro)/Cys-tRNA(Cys) deacylase
MSTRAIQFLKQKKIPFEIITYHHEEKGAAFAAGATGFALEKTVKTLVVALDTGTYVFALMPGNRKLDLKKTARVFGAKRAAMADVATAQRVTGYLVGGISPFGAARRLAVVIEKRVLDCDEIMINAGQRGRMLKMNPRDMVDILQGRIEDIGKT